MGDIKREVRQALRDTVEPLTPQRLLRHAQSVQTETQDPTDDPVLRAIELAKAAATEANPVRQVDPWEAAASAMRAPDFTLIPGIYDDHGTTAHLAISALALDAQQSEPVDDVDEEIEQYE